MRQRLFAAALAAAAIGALLALVVARHHARDAPEPSGGARPFTRQTLLLAHSPSPPPPRYELVPPAAPRGVVLAIADGMGVAHLAAGRLAAVGPDGRLQVERMPIAGLVATHTVDDLVTMSEASATALATGRKTRNGRVGSGPDGAPLRTLLEAARDGGLATGLVTTYEIVDATPAAFAAHVTNRAALQDIAAQLVESGVDVMLGAGRRHFLPPPGGDRQDGADLLARARQLGYEVVTSETELENASGDRLLGLFDIDLTARRPSEPSLVEMTRAALRRVAAGQRRFFLLIEEEGIDTRAHEHDIAGTAAAVSRFDAAVGLVLDFAAADGGVLVIATSDHETGGLVLDRGTLAAGRLEVIWADLSHSAVPVPLFAFGPGAERFGGQLDNTEVPRLLGEALRLDFR
jgi:alkaline phosphatase